MSFADEDDRAEGWEPGPQEGSPTKGPRPLVLVGSALAVALVVFELGSVFWGGYQFGSVQWDPQAFGGFTGIAFGSKVFYASAGATATVRYQIDIRRGSYVIYIKKLEPGMTGPVLRRLTFDHSATGDFTVPISQSGFYFIVTDGWAANGAFDVSHRIWWRIH